MIEPSHQLTSGRPIRGLLPAVAGAPAPRVRSDTNTTPRLAFYLALLEEPREMKLKRIVHEIWIDIGRVRKGHDVEAMWRVLRCMKELNRMGYVPIVLQHGRMVGAEDERFKGKPLATPERSSSPPSSNDQWLRFQEIKRQIEEMPEATQRTLLRELRMARKKKDHV